MLKPWNLSEQGSQKSNRSSGYDWQRRQDKRKERELRDIQSKHNQSCKRSGFNDNPNNTDFDPRGNEPETKWMSAFLGLLDLFDNWFGGLDNVQFIENYKNENQKDTTNNCPSFVGTKISH